MRTALIVSLLSLALTGGASAARPGRSTAPRVKGFTGAARAAIGAKISADAIGLSYGMGPLGPVQASRVRIGATKVERSIGQRVQVRSVSFNYRDGGHDWAGTMRFGVLLSADGKAAQRVVPLKRGMSYSKRPTAMPSPPVAPVIGPDGKPILPSFIGM